MLEKADEILAIYDLIGDVSTKIIVNEFKHKENAKPEKTKNIKKANLKPTKEIAENKHIKERVEIKEPKAALSTKKNTKQSALYKFIAEGEK